VASDAELQAQAATLAQAMGDTATSIVLARKTGQTTAATQLIAQLRTLVEKYKLVVVQLNQQEPPSHVAQVFASFSDDALSVVKEAGATARDLGQGAVGIVKYLPLIVITLIVVLGLVIFRRGWGPLRGRA
jgi:hypothetical protein